MKTGKSYNQILQDSIDRTIENMKKESDPKRILIQTYHIQYLKKQMKKKRIGLQSLGGDVCDIIDNLNC